MGETWGAHLRACGARLKALVVCHGAGLDTWCLTVLHGDEHTGRVDDRCVHTHVTDHRPAVQGASKQHLHKRRRGGRRDVTRPRLLPLTLTLGSSRAYGPATVYPSMSRWLMSTSDCPGDRDDMPDAPPA